MRPVSTFSDIQLSNSRRICRIFFAFFQIVFFQNKESFTRNFCRVKIPSLTVRKSKNRCIPYGYWAAAIFAVVADYSILFFPFTFFLNISHFTFCYELIICSETTDVMKIIRNSFSFV